MTQQFTPAQLEAWAGLGPWEWCENWLYVANYNEHPGPVLWYTANDDGVHAKPDDAALIAAAPDLARLVLEKDAEIAELKFEAGMKDKGLRLALKCLGELTNQTGTYALFASDMALIRQAMKETSDGI